jgi:hypothetical protein
MEGDAYIGLAGSGFVFLGVVTAVQGGHHAPWQVGFVDYGDGGVAVGVMIAAGGTLMILFALLRRKRG